MKTAIRNSIIFMGLALAGCGSSTTGGAGGTGVAGKSVGAVVVTALPDGAALYATDCAGCHGPLASSTKLGADPTRIQNAITSNTGGMSFLATLTAADIQAIATALAPVPPGVALYATNCAGCHGELTSSVKIGADSTRIQTAITSNTGGMSFLATLTATDIQSIADSLAPVPIGAALYASNCLVCHGGLSTTLKAGADSVRIQNAIASNTGGMSFLATLAPLQVQAIASALAVAPTGTLLYATNCAGCHGDITTSTKIGADFSRIQNAILNNTGGMNSFATLAATDIQAIAAVLTAP
jgi:mono/diheme cytochrome c family protein